MIFIHKSLKKKNLNPFTKTFLGYFISNAFQTAFATCLRNPTYYRRSSKISLFFLRKSSTCSDPSFDNFPPAHPRDAKSSNFCQIAKPKMYIQRHKSMQIAWLMYINYISKNMMAYIIPFHLVRFCLIRMPRSV